jgi:hypothetical protein
MTTIHNEWLDYYIKHVEHAIDFYIGACVYFYFLPFAMLGEKS